VPGVIRILTTTDLIGSVFPQPTSFGALPGTAALQDTVDRLRAEQPGSLWIDTGDLAQGSPLGSLSDGTWGFLAVGELDIDLGVIGNHELDWGLDHLHRWSTELGFGLLAANADLGFPATAVRSVAGRTVGVVGLTYPRMPELHPDVAVHADPAGLVRRHAAELRAQGCDVVVLAVHDGVDRVVADGRPAVDTERIERFCRDLDGAVDLVLGGHSLVRHVGEPAGVPFLQPWPFGTHVGVADIHPDGTVELSDVEVAGGRRRDGPGTNAHAALAAEVVGALDRPLVNTLDGRTELAALVAEGVLADDPDADLVAVAHNDLWNQAPVDGVLAYLPAGPVSREQVVRLTPLTGARSAWGGQLTAATLPTAEAEEIVERLRPAGVARRPGPRAHTTLVLPPFQAMRLAPGAPWRPAAVTWRAGLLRALAGTGR
jgi:2',3'-cyclic-nucleotide 2'-phosphodiesterase (5'-nucleotidase family)